MRNYPTYTCHIVCACFIFLCVNLNAQETLPPLTDSIDSKLLGETRGIQVKLPDDYKAGSGKKYEIVYILDGEWYHDLVPFTYNFAESANYIPKSILVLIRNRYDKGVNLRGRDFSPTRMSHDSLSGGADRFYEFVTSEVVPYIEKKYPSNGQRTLVGSSYSGLFCVYAYLKDPSFFHSYVASDPSLQFDNKYISRIAAKRLDSFPDRPGSLYIGGLTTTFNAMGIQDFDSVMKVHAPKSARWKSVAYPDESHYSVQLKAFYDGFRYVHYGFAKTPPEYHPMRGTVEAGKSFTVYSLNRNPGVRFTLDGAEPDDRSRIMVQDTSIRITAPTTLRLKTFGNRSIYEGQYTSEYASGKLQPVKSSRKVKGLNYSLYKGKWDSLPAITGTMKAEQTGTVDSTFTFAKFRGNVPFLLVIEGVVEVEKEAEYVFYTGGYGGVKFFFGDREMFAVADGMVNPAQSYVATLTKGRYPLRLEIFQKSDDNEPRFVIHQAKPGGEKWWETVWMRF